MGISSAFPPHGRSILLRRGRSGRSRWATAAGSLLSASVTLGACSLWVDETLSRKPAEAASAGGSGGATASGGHGGATTTGGGGQGGSGDCELACPAESCCEGACVDLDTSEAHCGACGNTCAATQACCDGQCAGDSESPCCGDLDCPGGKICSGNTCIPPCEGGLVACAGECVNLQSSPEHCGACGNDCLAGRSCAGGACSPAWVGMTSSGAPSAREHAAVAASGGLVFVWGGRDGSSDLADGGLYDPKTDVWKDIVPGDSTPSPRVFAAAVPAGSTVVVWGGGPSGARPRSGAGRGTISRAAPGLA